MNDLSNQVVIVTGAAGNLGKAVVDAFLEAGAKVACVDYSSDLLRQVYPESSISPERMFTGSADLTSQEDAARMAAQAVDRFGRIDVLVNTVGGYKAGDPLHETTLQTWEHMIDLNARTVFLASQAVIPQMLQQGSGKIISVAARPGLAGKANSAAYSASKSAVIRLTESMSEELREAGIRVNCIIPGTIDTSQNRQEMPSADHQRWVKPESLAGVILFLCTEAARDIHGAALPVYGLT
jgi:NAD(P)-dependent dehydrogenase (short-subunit alcohol dehydrogenase family)